MNSASFHILRVGMAITFLWIGILILKDPEAWAGFIQPWMRAVLPIPPVDIAFGTGFFDIFVGILLLIDFYSWLAALLGSLHLVLVLLAAGISEVTIRDIGLLAAAIALFLDSKRSPKIL